MTVPVSERMIRWVLRGPVELDEEDQQLCRLGALRLVNADPVEIKKEVFYMHHADHRGKLVGSVLWSAWLVFIAILNVAQTDSTTKVIGWLFGAAAIFMAVRAVVEWQQTRYCMTIQATTMNYARRFREGPTNDR